MTTILPCKGCGASEGTNQVMCDQWGDGYMVQCFTCGEISDVLPTEEEAIKSWNSQPPLARLKTGMADSKYTPAALCFEHGRLEALESRIEELEQQIATLKEAPADKAANEPPISQAIAALADQRTLETMQAKYGLQQCTCNAAYHGLMDHSEKCPKRYT